MPCTSVEEELIPGTLFQLQPLGILPAATPWQTSAVPRLSAGSSSGSDAEKARAAWAAAALGSLWWLSGVEPGEKGNTSLSPASFTSGTALSDAIV